MKKIMLAPYLVTSIFAFTTGCTILQQPIYSNKNGAIGGYDPVSYFNENQAIKGKDNLVYSYQGTTWHFSNQENKNLFIKTPNKYAPKYGGYCAYAMNYGFVVSSDPQAWSIINNNLYLNYSLGVREDWLKESGVYIKSADIKWAEKNKK